MTTYKAKKQTLNSSQNTTKNENTSREKWNLDIDLRKSTIGELDRKRKKRFADENKRLLIKSTIMKIDIFKANRKDLEVILKLQKECYITEAEIYNEYNIPPLTQDLKSLENEFENCKILKVVIDGEIVGSIRAFIDNDTTYIGKLIVKSEFQNKGIGKLLMDSIESTLCDCKRFELFTGFKSLKNLYLYNKLGYKEFKQQIISNDLTMIYLEKINTNAT